MVQEQTAAVVLEQTDPVEEQPLAVTPAPAEAVAADNGAVPFRFETDEDIRAHAEQDERLRSYLEKQRLDGENAGKQRRDRELRLERGTEEVAQGWQKHLADKYGIELDESDAKDAPLFVRANRDKERHDFWRTNTELVLDAFEADDRSKVEAALAQFEGRPDQMEAIGRQVYDTAVERTVSKRISDLTVDDILNLPVSSKLRSSFEEFKAAEFEKEAEAKAQERDVPPPPPRTPAGGVATQRTRNDYANLTPSQIAALPEDEYRIAMYGAA